MRKICACGVCVCMCVCLNHSSELKNIPFTKSNPICTMCFDFLLRIVEILNKRVQEEMHTFLIDYCITFPKGFCF